MITLGVKWHSDKCMFELIQEYLEVYDKDYMHFEFRGNGASIHSSGCRSRMAEQKKTGWESGLEL